MTGVSVSIVHNQSEGLTSWETESVTDLRTEPLSVRVRGPDLPEKTFYSFTGIVPPKLLGIKIFVYSYIIRDSKRGWTEWRREDVRGLVLREVSIIRQSIFSGLSKPLLTSTVYTRTETLDVRERAPINLGLTSGHSRVRQKETQVDQYYCRGHSKVDFLQWSFCYGMV